MPDKHALDQLPIDTSFTMATLAAGAGLINAVQSINQNFKAMSIHAVWGINPLADVDGPFLFGLADGELSLAEIEEYLEGQPLDARKAPEVEQVARPVQVIGGLGIDVRTTYLSGTRVRLPTFREDKGFTWWIYNTGITMTTGSFAKMRGRFFGRWLD